MKPALASKETCTGCSACYNACKCNAIVMEEDPVDGFKYPSIDTEKCSGCGLCEKACPIVSKKVLPKKENHIPYACVARNRDESVRMQSSSGGVFSAVAEVILKRNGIVFGAYMDEEFRVKHTFVDSIEGLSLFRKSKYVQSEIGDSFSRCKEFLDSGRWVCFSGTPCQIKGLLFYLDYQYKKLITIDVVCLSVPSPLVFRKYLGYQKSKGFSFDSVSFRDKKYGYSYSNMVFSKQGKEVIRGGSESDPWLRLFLNGYCDRSSCYKCSAQMEDRECDITLWDCYRVRKIAPDLDDNKGATSCVAWTEKGTEILSEAKRLLDIVELPYGGIENALIRKNKKARQDRDQFFQDVKQMDDTEFIKKYVPETPRLTFVSFVRRILIYLHIHDTVRNVVSDLRRKQFRRNKSDRASAD